MTRRSDWARRYPPLAGALVAALIAIVVLPSALNVPQSNPTQTLEFAPIPPEDDQPTPPDSSNLESLSLGSSDTAPSSADAEGGAGPVLPPPPEVPEGVGTRPVTKRCVGDPPRQTEDPNSPPCVAHFDGDNGGATAQGVTADRVTIVVYIDRANRVDGSRTPPVGTFTDVSDPGGENGVDVRVLAGLERHFNTRFQTYLRHVDVWLQIAGAEQNSFLFPDRLNPEVRRADAAEVMERLEPFAVINAAGSFKDDYTTAVAEQGVMVFQGVSPGESSGIGEPAANFARYPGLLWSYAPSLEQRAATFVSAACTQVEPYPVSFTDQYPAGDPRVFGLYRASSDEWPGVTYWGELIRDGLEDCGMTFAGEGTVESQCNYCSARPDEQQDAAATMAAFQRDGVTTIIWAAGSNQIPSDHAASLEYHPEWVIAGDSNWADSTLHAQHRDQDLWEHTRAVTLHTYNAGLDERPCGRAAAQSNPSEPRDNVALYYCGYYPYFLQLFTGIQVAGPRLTPANVDDGFHAIPDVPSSHPSVPACFYLPGDYTCVKDATLAWWDPSGTSSNGTQGCWRLYAGGQRYLVGGWPDRDIDAGRSPEDPCNLQGAHAVNA